MSQWVVVIPDRVSDQGKIEKDIFGSAAREVRCLNVKTNAEFKGKIEDAHAILAWHDLIWDKETLRSLKNCKSIVRVGAGFDNVDLAAAKEMGITVSNVPDYGTHDVADHAMALLLALARGLNGHNEISKTSPVGWKWGLVPTFRLTNKVMGIVGLGRIGTAVALRAKAFGLRVGFYDPYKAQGWDKSLGLNRFDSLEELARACDIVSLHVPLTPETKGMINSSFWENAKRGMTVINTARGPVLDWKCFTQAFDAGIVARAGFDVLPQEPLDPNDPFFKKWLSGEKEGCDRLLVTPHCAFYSEEAVVEMRTKAAQEALRVLKGERPLNQVNV
ncbi:MAG: C-terminal binding protein [Oligoflexia bacterium]|nr:C-terminal binding protein [Oligoflexia bacterium]